jgi:sporulation protein YlmC with PRC-barrel domain
MKTRLFVMAVAATVGVAGGLLAVQNQQPNQQQPDVEIEADDVEIERQQQQQRQRENLQETSRRQQKQIVHRASALIGMEVQNSAGKDLGDIDDLAIGDDGKIEYAAVSFGGFANIGDKLFAVPWDSIQIKQVDPQGDDWVAVMTISVTEQELENAQGFDKENWPNMADPKWKAQNAQTFRTTERPERELEQQPTPRR